MLQVSLFGHLRLALDGTEWRFSGRPKTVPLLASVLLHGGAQPRDSIAFTLWPDDTEEDARANLRRHLGYLRDALPKSDIPWLLTGPETVGWNPAMPVWVDVVEFDRLVGDPEGRRAAIDLYCGELLTDHYDEWIVAARERYRASYLAALWALAVEARGRRDVSAAAAYLNRILSDDPWREDAVRTLMAVRYEAGDRAGALRLSAQFEARLRDEMHVPLMAETAAMRAAIERDEPLPTVPPQRAADAVKAAPAELPFAGRDREMARLENAWERALEGHGTAVLIVGEAGIGKTRLTTEFAMMLEARGARVLWGTTSDPEARPYQALSEALRAGAGFLPSVRLVAYERDVLRRVLPNVFPEDAVQPLAETNAEQSRLFQVVADVLSRLAAQRPLVLVLDDVHRAGPASVALLQYLQRRVSTTRMLLVLAGREAEAGVGDTLRLLRRPPDGEPAIGVSLGPIAGDAALDIASRSNLSGVDERARAAIAARSNGHPLFLRELLHTADEIGDVPASLPRGLRELIDERLNRLSSQAQLLLGAASVVGSSFDLDVVSDVVGWSEAELVDAADELVARHAIRETAAPASFDFQFAHDLIASASYERLGERERRRWHRRTGRVAERHYASRLDERASYIARHYDVGGDAEAAARYYLRAAHAAYAAFANDETLTFTARALELKPRAPALRYDLLAQRVAVHDRRCDRDAQRVDQALLDAVVRELDDAERRCEALRLRSLLHFRTGEAEDGRRAVEALLHAAVGKPRWEGVALRMQAMFAAQRGDNESAYASMRAAVEKFAGGANLQDLIGAVVFQALLAALLGRRSEAMALVGRAGEIAEEAQTPWSRLQVAYCKTQVLTQFGEWHNLSGAASALIETAQLIGDRMHLALGHSAMAVWYQRDRYDFASARRHFERSLALFRDAEFAGELTAYTNLAGVEIEMGRFERAAAFADQIIVASKGIGGTVWPGYAAEVRAYIALRRGDLDEAIRFADRCIALAAESNDAINEAQGFLVKGNALRDRGDVAGAISHLLRSHELASANGAAFFARGPAAELALAYACAGYADEAAASVDEALRPAGEAEDAMPREAPLAVLWPIARTLRLLGRREHATEVLARAHALFVAELGYLSDEKDCAAFTRLPANLEMLRAYEDDVWPEDDSERSMTFRVGPR